jgi:cell division protein FtsI (penicillin-binding protein 3)
MDPRQARLLAEMLTTVTEEGGTGVDAAIPGVRVAGKTGTAQKANLHGRGYDATRWTASFMGFAPADRPAITVTVVIDEPQIAHQGGTVAAPLFRRVAEQTLRYLGRLPAVPGATPALPPAARDRDATTEVGQRGAATRSGRGGDVARAQGVVPSVLSMTARQALRALDASWIVRSPIV